MIPVKHFLPTLILMALLPVGNASGQQTITQKHVQRLTPPQGYVAYRTNQAPSIDGKLDEADWALAPWTTPFCDISGDGYPTPRFLTRAKVLWDNDCLYIAAQLEEPNVWATLTQRDTIIYHDPDFEVFLDPDNDAANYFEIEVNALATVFDLFLAQPYRAPIHNFVSFAYDTPGLRVATDVQGTLNNPADTDKGWTVEMAIPRKAIAASWDNYLVAGKYLRVGMSRVEWQTVVDSDGHILRKTDDQGRLLPEDNWTWGATGLVAMHMPERWGYVYLSPTTVGTTSEEFRYPQSFATDRLLWAMFYEQESHHAETGRYISCLADFHLSDEETGTLPQGSAITVEATSRTYEIAITDGEGHETIINQNGHIKRNYQE